MYIYIINYNIIINIYNTFFHCMCNWIVFTLDVTRDILSHATEILVHLNQNVTSSKDFRSKFLSI